MKWVKSVRIILGALVGALLVGYGVGLAITSLTFGIVLIVAGVVVFWCALIFHLKWAKLVVITLGASGNRNAFHLY